MTMNENNIIFITTTFNTRKSNTKKQKQIVIIITYIRGHSLLTVSVRIKYSYFFTVPLKCLENFTNSVKFIFFYPTTQNWLTVI